MKSFVYGTDARGSSTIAERDVEGFYHIITATVFKFVLDSVAECCD